MNIETERRFLINTNSDGFSFKIFTKKFTTLYCEKITQYYFKNNTKDISMRIRDEYFEATHKHQYTLNIKSNIDLISRYEFEKIITKKEFDFFKNHCNKVLEKIRFIVKCGRDEWEINYIPLKRLLIAEIELKKKDKKLSIPFNFEKEITDDVSYLAENIAEEF